MERALAITNGESQIRCQTALSAVCYVCVCQPEPVKTSPCESPGDHPAMHHYLSQLALAPLLLYARPLACVTPPERRSIGSSSKKRRGNCRSFATAGSSRLIALRWAAALVGPKRKGGRHENAGRNLSRSTAGMHKAAFILRCTFPIRRMTIRHAPAERGVSAGFDIMIHGIRNGLRLDRRVSSLEGLDCRVASRLLTKKSKSFGGLHQTARRSRFAHKFVDRRSFQLVELRLSRTSYDRTRLFQK